MITRKRSKQLLCTVAICGLIYGFQIYPLHIPTVISLVVVYGATQWYRELCYQEKLDQLTNINKQLFKRNALLEEQLENKPNIRILSRRP